MTKNEIQEQRMRGYFIDATRTILKGEGLRAVSVRNVAEIAGYSYATLYNYFRDVKDLVFECVCDFQNECTRFVEEKVGEEAPGLRRIRAITIAYMKYFVEYPGIFELFFIEKPSEIANKQPTV
ncbi:MAG: TetR/AcrR family transcriptional regulator, partial [Negativicutes bacterium]|nr:TetR/AcrR family transcriptional regulator [Negativicutes bacterium]